MIDVTERDIKSRYTDKTLTGTYAGYRYQMMIINCELAGRCKYYF